MNLIQGDMVVKEYEKRFIELAKYALAFVVDKAYKSKLFGEALVEVSIRVERCLVDERNKILMEDLCGQSFSDTRGAE